MSPKSIGTDPLALTSDDMKWLVGDIQRQQEAERAAQQAARGPTGVGGVMARSVPLGIGDLLHAFATGAGANPMAAAMDAGIDVGMGSLGVQRPGIQKDAASIANTFAAPPEAGSGMQTLESVLRGAIGGAPAGPAGVAGGVGAGLGQDVASRLGFGPIGQTVGGLAGGALGTGAAAVAGRMNPANRAARGITKQVERGGEPLRQEVRLAKGRAAADPSAPGAETLGRAGDELAQQVATEGGRAGESVVAAAYDRANRAQGKFLADIQNQFAKRGDLDVTESLTRAQDAATGPTYDKLRYKPVVITDELAALLDDPIMQRAYDEGVSIHNSRVENGKPVMPFPSFKNIPAKGGPPTVPLAPVSAKSAGALFRKLIDAVGRDLVDELLFYWEDRGGGPTTILDDQGRIRVTDAEVGRATGGARSSGVRQGGTTKAFVEWLREAKLDMNDIQFSDAVKLARGTVRGESGRGAPGSIPLGALDEMKRGIDNLVQRGERGEAGGITRRQADAIAGRLDAVRGAVDQQVPEYGQVRAQSKAFFDQKNALQFGRELLDPSTTDDLVRQRLGELDQTNPALRVQVKMGLADAFHKGKIPADWSSNPQIRARVAALVTPEEFATLDKQINRALRTQERAARVVNAGEARLGSVSQSRAPRVFTEIALGLFRSATRDQVLNFESKVRFPPPVRAEVAATLNAQGPEFMARMDDLLRRMGIQQTAPARGLVGAGAAIASPRESRPAGP